MFLQNILSFAMESIVLVGRCWSLVFEVCISHSYIFFSVLPSLPPPHLILHTAPLHVSLISPSLNHWKGQPLERQVAKRNLSYTRGHPSIMKQVCISNKWTIWKQKHNDKVDAKKRKQVKQGITQQRCIFTEAVLF